MTRVHVATAVLLAAGLVLPLAACDGTYTPGTHHMSDASTGSMLQGTDTGANSNGMSDPGIRNLNQSGAASGG